MFMAAGLIGEALGHDRIAGFGGIGRALPMTVFAFGLGGMSLMGLPPSGGFVAKAMLLTAAVGEGQWWWAVVVLLGGLLAAGYVFRVLAPALAAAEAPPDTGSTVSQGRQARGAGACGLRAAAGPRTAAALPAAGGRPAHGAGGAVMSR